MKPKLRPNNASARRLEAQSQTKLDRKLPTYLQGIHKPNPVILQMRYWQPTQGMEVPNSEFPFLFESACCIHIYTMHI